MDLYLEQPEIWPDFHDGVIACVRGQLQPMLCPRYAALTQGRLYVVEAERPIRPDVAVIETRRRRKGDENGGTATVRVSAEKLASVAPYCYLAAVTRCVTGQELVFAIQLRQRLPRVAIPLDETDVTLDLQAAFERC